MGRYDDYKQRVLRMSQTLSAQGYFGSRSGTAGNVSMLVEGEEAIVVTPTRLPYDVMTAEDICVVDFDLGRIEGKRKPSIETPMHVAAYQARADVSAVIHTHQTFASAISILNQPIPPLFDEVALAIGNLVEVVPYALSGTRELHDNVARKLANRCHCYILQNHGALCVGPDLDQTFTFVELLEKIADDLYPGARDRHAGDDAPRKDRRATLCRGDREAGSRDRAQAIHRAMKKPS